MTRCSASHRLPRIAAVSVALLLAGLCQPALAAAPAAESTATAALHWHNDYYAAYRAAEQQQQMLLVLLEPAGSSQGQSLDAAIAARPALQAKLQQVTLCRLPSDAAIDVEGQSRRLASFAAFRELNGGSGIVLIDLQHRDAPYFGRTVTALPLAGGKYYRWSVDNLAVALDLPAGTLTQRSMIWAVRMHPERPQSTNSVFNPSLAAGATQQASYQAQVRQCGHQNFETRFHQLSAAVGSGVTEVCAESWPNQTMIDSCLDCVASWRHSSGHWNGVSRPHRAYAYDIRQGANGIWYGTGLFAD